MPASATAIVIVAFAALAILIGLVIDDVLAVRRARKSERGR